MKSCTMNMFRLHWEEINREPSTDFYKQAMAIPMDKNKSM